MDLWLDMYTYNDSAPVAWYAGMVAVPLAGYTIYLGRETFFTKWYYAVLSFIVVYGIYLFTVYFSILNTDLLFSSIFERRKKEVLHIEHIERVFTRKAGFIHTNITVRYRKRMVAFEGTRTSYFFLKNKTQVSVHLGQSHTGNLYVTGMSISQHERWEARWLYVKDWLAGIGG